MEEIIRHLQWIRRHCKWAITRLQGEPSPAAKQQVIELAIEAGEMLGVVRKLLGQ